METGHPIHETPSQRTAPKGQFGIGLVLIGAGLLGAAFSRSIALRLPGHGVRGYFAPPWGADLLTGKGILTYGMVTAVIGIFILRFAIIRKQANQSSDPTLPSGTPPAGQEPRPILSQHKSLN